VALPQEALPTGGSPIGEFFPQGALPQESSRRVVSIVGGVTRGEA